MGRADQHLRRGLFGLYQAHPEQRGWIGRVLLRCIELGGDLGYRTARLPFADDLVQPLRSGLRELAGRGAPDAIVALALAEDHHPAVLAEGKRRVAQLLDEEPRRWSGGDFRADLGGQPRAEAACFALLLPPPTIERVARHLLRLAAEGTGEVDPARSDALDGIAVLAQRLPDATRDELVQPVLTLAQASADSPVDSLWQRTLDPLSPGKVDLGRRRPAAALVAAAELARRPEHGRAVLAAASELAAQADTAAEQAAARAIVTLVNRRLVMLDPAQVLQISASVPFRELAVIAWLHSHDPAPERGEQFARDPARSVRLAVAEALPRLRTVAAGVVEPLLARLRHDPSARVRRTFSENSNRAA